VVGQQASERYSRQEVRRWLNVTERQLRSWEKQGLIAKLDSYGFADLIALRSLIKLRKGKVPAEKIRQAVAALRDRLRDVDNPLVELKLYTEGKKVRVQVGGQTMEPVTGQLLLDFGAGELRRMVSFPEKHEAEPSLPARRAVSMAADRLFEEALDLEQRGAVEDAIQVYQQVLQADPYYAGALLNLGTIHFAARDFGKARQYYQQAIDADPNYALARFNLANVFDELGNRLEALLQYQAALKLQPDYADAHYNIALLYQASGQLLRAVRHWKIYLKLDPGSPWAAIARRELERLYRETVVETGGPTT
jgi:tetratricopeptide (TPR) repeat protein